MPFVSHNRTWELADIWRKSASQNDSFLERHTVKLARKAFFFLSVCECVCVCVSAWVSECVHTCLAYWFVCVTDMCVHPCLLKCEKIAGCSVRTCLRVCLWMCVFVCVCVCPCTNAPSLLQLTSRWMLAVTPAWLCSCQMRWGHRESAQTLINLNHCPTFFRLQQQLPISI